jgi:hypothetical protein
MNIAKINSKTIDRYKIIWEQRSETLTVNIPIPRFRSTPANVSAVLIMDDDRLVRCPGGGNWNPSYDKKNKQFIIELNGIDNMFIGTVELEFDIITKVKL